MHKSEVMSLLKEKRWTVSALAERWGYSRRHVTSRIANENRGQLWNDAFAGLPIGPGFYRLGLAKPTRRSEFELGVGALVASESDMYTFDYGTKGVVLAQLGFERWLVFWDGSGEMEIDGQCLREWVMDLGHEHVSAARLRELDLPARIALARRLDLNS